MLSEQSVGEQEKEEQDAAATVVQSAVRGKLARKVEHGLSEEKEEQDAAATVIQSAVRGKKAKMVKAEKFQEKQTKEAMETEEWGTAATKLQATHRGRRDRQVLREQADAATKLQAVHRGQQARRNGVARSAPQPLLHLSADEELTDLALYSRAHEVAELAPFEVEEDPLEALLLGEGTRQVEVCRSSGTSLGLRIASDKELDKRRLWGLPEIRLPDKLGQAPFRQRPVVAWVDPQGGAARAGLLLDDVVLAINGHLNPSSVDFGDLIGTDGTSTFIVRPVAHLPSVASMSKQLPLKAKGSTAKPCEKQMRQGDVLSELTGSPTSSFTAVPTAVVWVPVPRVLTTTALTPRGMKSSILLHKELKDVSRSMSKMMTRVDQALAVVRGTQQELFASVESCRKNLEQNPSLRLQPTDSDALEEARDEVRKDVIRETYIERYGVEPSEATLKHEFKLEVSKVARRRSEANKPVLQAMAELEEIASLGAQTLGTQEETLLNFLTVALPQRVLELDGHCSARHQVVQTKDRFTVSHLEDHATHECLRLAAEQENSARAAVTEALKIVRRERSALEVCKADLQRAMQEKGRILARHRVNNRRGTTFTAWNSEDIKNMTQRSRLLQ